MQPGEILKQRVQINGAEVEFRDGAVLPVIGHLAGADPEAGLQIVAAEAVGRRLLRRTQDHRRAVDVVAAEHTDGALAEAVVRNDREKCTVDPEVGQRQRDVGLAAAVAGFEAGGHADLLIVGRRQAEHDLADGDKPGGCAVVSGQWVGMLHISYLLYIRI